MEALNTIFSTENEIVEKLKENTYKPDYKKIFFEHLGPELKKIFTNRKDKVYLKNFLEALQYEYGFFDTEIDLSKAFNLYKTYADINDYFCMYKMHVIYLCEYEKFNVPFSRVLEKIYLLKCFAYLPNYIIDWDMNFFDKINIKVEIAQMLELEDDNFEKHQLFFDLLYNEKEKYNLSENDINLMKCVLFCYFDNKGSDLSMMSFSIMESLMPKHELDYAYYTAKNKCIFFNSYLNLENAFTDSETQKFFNEIKNKKLYEFYADYGLYLLDKKIRANPEIIELLTSAANNGYLFCNFKAYQCLIDYYDFEDIIQDYNKASTLLDYTLDHIVFEKLALSYFVIWAGLFIKYSTFQDKIISKYLIYVKEINDYITTTIIKKEKANEMNSEDDYFYFIKGYIYFFGFKDIEEQNLFKAVECLDKASNLCEQIYGQKIIEFIKYKAKEIMHNNKNISNDEFIKAKKDLIEFYYDNSNLKDQVFECYIIGKDFIEGITREKDELSGLLIYNLTNKIFCKHIIDCFVKKDIKKILKENEDKIEKKFKDEICCICYTNKVSKAFIPCKHTFCDFCADKLENNSKKCPVCRTEYLYII